VRIRLDVCDEPGQGHLRLKVSEEKISTEAVGNVVDENVGIEGRGDVVRRARERTVDEDPVALAADRNAACLKLLEKTINQPLGEPVVDWPPRCVAPGVVRRRAGPRPRRVHRIRVGCRFGLGRSTPE